MNTAHNHTSLAGYTNVGSDMESGEFWRLDRRDSLPVLERWTNDGHRYSAHRLPDGDIMLVINGKSWTRYTKDKARREEFAARSTIVGYRYDPRLLVLLVELERLGVKRGGLYSWFGGTHGIRELEITCVARCYAQQGHAQTAVEKFGSLSEYLGAVRPKGAAADIVSDARKLLETLGTTAIVAIIDL